jgi:hypothetical protein
LSTDERRGHDAEWTTADTVAGFLAAAALAAGVLALVWYPGRVGPAAMLIALVAAAMGRGQSGRDRLLARRDDHRRPDEPRDLLAEFAPDRDVSL